MMKSLRARISGRVQGVWYRGWTVETARRLGLAGWVRNRADGSVEALFHGPESSVEAMIDLCRQGPPSARVDRIECDAAAPPEDGGFHQRPTA